MENKTTENKGKITNRTRFLALYDLAEQNNRPDLMEFVNKEIAKLDNKNAKTRATLTPTQLENISIKEDIYAELAKASEPMSIGELFVTESFKDLRYSSQKFSALLRQMIKDGLVVSSSRKGTTVFALVKEDRGN